MSAGDGRTPAAPLTGARVAQLAEIACLREVCAPKPGNVSRRHDFSDATLEDYLISAAAIRPCFERAARWPVGKIVLEAARSARGLVGTNTNLGIILLLAPPAKAAVRSAGGGLRLRQRIGATLQALTVEDARLAYEAIRLMRPAGMGRVPEADIAGDPGITLLAAMELAAERDAVAREYATGYSVTYETGLPALRGALGRGAAWPEAIVHAFLSLLGRMPDTLIARKRGMETASGISRRAEDVLKRGSVFTPEGRRGLEELERLLGDPVHSLNPGATADLTAAAIFLELLERESG